jgi:hypothetical protein
MVAHATTSTAAIGKRVERGNKGQSPAKVIQKPWMAKISNVQKNNALGRLWTIAIGWKP